MLKAVYYIPISVSRKCGKLLKKFLLLNPSKKITLEPIKKDPQMSKDHEDELSPYVEPLPDAEESWPTDLMMSFCHTREEIQDSLIARSTTK